jgi:uncharacterized repeat protein (TIGR02543 family)
MQTKIEYELNSGVWAPKDEVKEAFYTDLFNFVNANFDSELQSMALSDFITSEPYIIGNICGEFYLKEEVGGILENQPADCFIGYCYQNNKYLDLIPHLIHFFALWRDIEGCTELNATDFFASNWASLVDTAKFFKYTTIGDLEKSPESPTVRCEPILTSLQNCPGVYTAPTYVNHDANVRLAKPRRDKYEFLGWYLNQSFTGDKLTHISKDTVKDVKLYARWGTHTYFHSNDGYANFDDLYTDFLNDFSTSVGVKVGKEVERMGGHGPVSEFCKVSFGGNLNRFFATKDYFSKWWWLIEYIRSIKKNDEEAEKNFAFSNGRFGLEAQARWELNSLFVSRFHLVYPKTSDYSGAGIKEKIADFTNSAIIKVKYPVGEEVSFPKVYYDDHKFVGWYDNPKGNGEQITKINDDRFAGRILYAKWQ